MAEAIALLLDLYRAASEQPLDEFQGYALHLIQPLLNFESARWGAGCLTPAGFKPHVVHLQDDPEDSIGEWQEVMSQDTIVTEVVERPRVTVSSQASIRYADRDKAGIRRYARKFRHENILATAYVSPERGLVEWISLYRGNPDDCFSANERQICESVVPHLMQALSINRNLRIANPQGREAGSWPSFAIADRLGVLWFSEPRFLELIHSEWPGIREPHLPGALMEAIVRKGGAGGVGTLIQISAAPAGKFLLLRARKRGPLDALTPRELEIVHSYGRGHTHKEVAQILLIAPETVRHHLRNAFRKLGIGDKAELARLLIGANER